MEIGSESKLADELCGAMNYGHIDPNILTADQVRVLLGKMVPVSDLNEHHVGLFLNWAAGKYPRELLTFVLQRIDLYRSLDEDSEATNNYSAVPHHGLSVGFHGLSHTDQYAGSLQEVAKRLSARADVMERHWLKELFWLVGMLDDTTLSIIDDLLHSADLNDVETALIIISEGPSDIALSRPYFAVHAIDSCANHSVQLKERAIGLFIGNTHKGVSTSVPGQPPPKFTSLKDRASELAQRFEPGTTGNILFNQIREAADRRIQEHKIDDDDFLFEHS